MRLVFDRPAFSKLYLNQGRYTLGVDSSCAFFKFRTFSSGEKHPGMSA